MPYSWTDWISYTPQALLFNVSITSQTKAGAEAKTDTKNTKNTNNTTKNDWQFKIKFVLSLTVQVYESKDFDLSPISSKVMWVRSHQRI